MGSVTAFEATPATGQMRQPRHATWRVCWALSICVTLIVVASVADAQERFSAMILSSERLGSQGFLRLEVWLDRYSTGEERERLRELLQGADDANRHRRFLDEAAVGRLHVVVDQPSSPWPRTIQYAEVSPAENGGRVITLVSTTPLWLLSPVEVRDARPENPFGVIRFRLSAQGSGDGGFFPSAWPGVDATGAIRIDEDERSRSFQILHVRAW